MSTNLQTNHQGDLISTKIDLQYYALQTQSFEYFGQSLFRAFLYNSTYRDFLIVFAAHPITLQYGQYKLFNTQYTTSIF